MKKIDTPTAKLLEKPMAKQIITLLVDDDLSITQIVKRIPNSDNQTIVAFLAELQRFGFVELSETNSKKTDLSNKTNTNNFQELEILTPKMTQFPPLGISVLEYNKLWEDLSRDNGQINLQELENSTFTVPSTLKHLFKTNLPKKE